MRPPGLLSCEAPNHSAVALRLSAGSGSRGYSGTRGDVLTDAECEGIRPIRANGTKYTVSGVLRPATALGFTGLNTVATERARASGDLGRLAAPDQLDVF